MSDVPHPWYGPCDSLGPNGVCAECLKPATLIARLEAASEGSRELDGAIYRWLHPKRCAQYADDREIGHAWAVNLWSTSRDAALPEERIIKTEIDAEGWHATALNADGVSVYGFGKTEALARRIAALKARAEKKA